MSKFSKIFDKDFTFVFTAKCLFLSQSGAPTKAARGIIKSNFFKIFLE